MTNVSIGLHVRHTRADSLLNAACSSIDKPTHSSMGDRVDDTRVDQAREQGI